MGILDEDVARVRDSTDLVAVASEHMGLRRVGRRWQGLCPFHPEKTPSFSVNKEKGFYYCFGCGAHGDAIGFVREIEHLDFVGAVERLAAKAGITLRYDDAAAGVERQRRQRLADAQRLALDLYHRLLLEGDEAGNARRYLRSRGYGGDVARQFSIGFAPDRFDYCVGELSRARFSREEILDAGLAFVNRSNRLQDHFRDRVMFPIFDARGDAIGFGGRALAPGVPKYKNSPETALYQKSRVLYGLNWAKEDVVAKGQVIVCEGYTDVIAFFLAGVPRAVATCGTALGEDHLRILRNFSRNLVLAYDADDAGQSASERIYQWEARYEMRLSVADLPAGSDPADVGGDDPAALVRAVDGARPFLQFRLDRLLAGGDLASAEGRAATAKAAMALIAGHPDDLVRDQYLMALSERVGIDAERLRRVAQPAARNPAGGAPAPAARPTGRRNPKELEALRVAVHEPALVAGRLVADAFSDPLARAGYDALAGAETFHEALAGADPTVRALLQRLAVEDLPWGEADPAAYASSVVAGVVEAAGGRAIAGMVRAGDDRASELKHLLDELVAARSGGLWVNADQVVSRLLPWVEESGRQTTQAKGEE